MDLLQEEVAIDAPADAVWRALKDPATVAACIPGARIEEPDANGTRAGSLAVKFGPTKVVFKGEVELEYDEASRSCVVRGKGVDGRGASRVTAEGQVRVRGEAASILSVSCAFSVAGPLEAFAASGGVHIGRAILGLFAENLGNRLSQTLPANANADAPQRALASSSGAIREGAVQANEVDAGARRGAPPSALGARQLLRRALSAWLRSLWGRGSRRQSGRQA